MPPIQQDSPQRRQGAEARLGQLGEDGGRGGAPWDSGRAFLTSWGWRPDNGDDSLDMGYMPGVGIEELSWSDRPLFEVCPTPELIGPQQISGSMGASNDMAGGNQDHSTSGWDQGGDRSLRIDTAGDQDLYGGSWDRRHAGYGVQASTAPSSPIFEGHSPFLSETGTWPDVEYGDGMGWTGALGGQPQYGWQLASPMDQGGSSVSSMPSLTSTFSDDSTLSFESDTLSASYDPVVIEAPQLDHSLGAGWDFGCLSGEPTLSMTADEQWDYQSTSMPLFEQTGAGRPDRTDQDVMGSFSWKGYDDKFVGLSSSAGHTDAPFVEQMHAGSTSSPFLPTAVVVPTSYEPHPIRGSTSIVPFARQRTRHGPRSLAPKPSVRDGSIGMHSRAAPALHPQPMPKTRKGPEDTGMSSYSAEADSAKTWPCPSAHCGKRFARPDNAKRHEKGWRERRSRMFSFRCEAPGCPRGYSRRDKLIAHMANSHPGLGNGRR
ncbi:hypothetical protein HWV62_18436 [Athelia sp. TMB]|nr:hypothetical protein HWV62_18436 [Athelia sp. TMB]